MILVSAEASSNETLNDVVSLAFCESKLSPEDNMGKETLEDLHTFAELKHDPTASLPDSFTICSTIMITSCQSSEWPSFFNIFDMNGDQFLVPLLGHGSIESRLGMDLPVGHVPKSILTGKLPPLFPDQWTRSCVAVNSTSGVIHWVVEGTLVLANEFQEVKNSKSRPKDLSRKLVLGANSFGGFWRASTQKVTNLQIFSSALPIEKMRMMTEGGGECAVEGDYLAWVDMEWILHGKARKETIKMEEACEKKPLVDLFYAEVPGGMDSCMHALSKCGQ